MSDVVIESVLGTAARLLVRQNHNKAAHLLANGGGRVRLYDDSNGDYDVWQFLLAIPAEVYFDIPDRPNIEQQINDALTRPVRLRGTEKRRKAPIPQ